MEYFKSQVLRFSQIGVGVLDVRSKMPRGPFFKNLLPEDPKKAAKDFHEKLLQAVGPRFSIKEQMFFARRLAFLINAGVPLIESLSIMRAQARRRSEIRILDHVLKDVANGQSLSRSFSKFPRVFGGFTISILRVGETSGTLSMSLAYLADELKKRQLLVRKVVSAFIYPAIITAATVAITAFLMLYLFPKIMPIFESLDAELPFTTKLVMGMSVFMQQWGLLFMLGVVFVSVVLTLLVTHNRILHFYFDHLLVRLPVVGRVVRFYNVANMTRTLGLLLRSGVKLSDALPITAETTKNLVYKGELERLSEIVYRGERISTHIIKEKRYFPQIVGHMIAVGERSGTLSDTLTYLSDLYEHEVDEFTKNLSTMVEPALMIIMGLIVGLIAVSIITPIYGITQNLHA